MADNLWARIPVGRRATDEELLDLFFEWVGELGIEPYPAQEEAVLEIWSGNHVILNTPTGSGKSLVATAAHFWCAARNRRSFYTAPTKALVNEKFFALCDTFGAEQVGMLTGDAAINRMAPIVCCTAEILSNMCLRQGRHTPVEFVVMDEFHFYGDRDRGMAWQVPLITLPDATFLLMSGTLGDTRSIARRLERDTGRPVRTVVSSDRPVPLEFEYRESPIHETVAALLHDGRYPVYLVNFTQRECAEEAQNLMSVPLCGTDARKAIARELKGVRFDTPYGKVVSRFLNHGVGIHHAGLLPKYRLLVERLAQKGLLPVVSGTDTLGVGVNVPIRTVLFTKLCKFDGHKVRILSVRDFHQISGRAGRKGFDDRGWVVCQAPAHVIERRRAEARSAGASGKRRSAKARRPAPGSVSWDERTFRRLVEGTPEPLRSRFTVTHPVILNCLQRPAGSDPRQGGYRAVVDLIARSHESPVSQSRLRRKAAALFRSLVRAEVVRLEPRPDGRKGRVVRLAEDLDTDFSVFHVLSVYLVEAIRALEPEEETYALDVLSLVEAIQENPVVILRQQERKIRGRKLAELKAQGMEYEARMEELEKITYPKPCEEFIEATFAAFVEHHPWAAAHPVEPKSIAREMFERCESFNGYVRDYGLERVEGLLLRYLSTTYQTLVQTVPPGARTDGVVEITAFLRSTLARADSSLVREWERRAGIGVGPEEDEAAEPPPADLSADPGLFAARIRADLHALVKALAARDYEEAALCLRVREGEGDEDAWTPRRLEAEMAPFYDEYEELRFDHSARLSERTQIRKVAGHLWEVRQQLVDDRGDNFWSLEGRVDLRGDPAPDGPLFELLRIRS